MCCQLGRTGPTLQSSLNLNPVPDDCSPCAYFRKFTLEVRVEWDQRRGHGRNLGQWSRKKEIEPQGCRGAGETQTTWQEKRMLSEGRDEAWKAVDASVLASGWGA